MECHIFSTESIKLMHMNSYYVLTVKNAWGGGGGIIYCEPTTIDGMDMWVIRWHGLCIFQVAHVY